MMTERVRVSLVWLLVLAFSSALFLSLDVNAHRKDLYLATLAKKPASGLLSVVFYANRYSRYVADGSIRLAAADWKVTDQSDSTVLTARNEHAAMIISSYGTPIYLSLLRLPGAGSAILTDGTGAQRDIDLNAAAESLYSFTVGGKESTVPAIPGSPLDPHAYYSVYGLILLCFSVLALYHSSPAKPARNRTKPRSASSVELLGYATPLLITALLVQLAYWPASTAYDGGLQWMEAAVPGTLNAALVIPATLLFRLFAKLAGGPAYLIFAQIAAAAIGVSLVLQELRERGVPRWAAQLGALCLAITPQFPTFFATISKDTWNCVGILLITYFALALLRRCGKDVRTVGLAAMLGAAAVFAGAMRPNTLPAILCFMLVLALFFRPRLGTPFALTFFVLYLGCAVIAPAAVFHLSAEGQVAPAAGAPHGKSRDPGPGTGAADRLPLGAFADIYIFHLFAALVHHEVPIPAQDAAVFFAVAPKAAWQEYDCSYHDKTQIAVENAKLLDQAALPAYLAEHQAEMAGIVLRMLLRHPGILLERQACVSQLLWYIGYDAVTFQATATLGYDSVPAPFLAAVGANRSLIGDFSRRAIAGYVAWSETWNHFWIFWKPFLYTGLGLFAVLLYSIIHWRSDLLVIVTLPVMLTLSLALVIPFPAFRYQYPATLLFMLFFLLSFARPSGSRTHPASRASAAAGAS